MIDKRDDGNDGTWLDPELAEATRNQKHISLLEAATLPSKEFTPPTLPKTAPSETPTVRNLRRLAEWLKRDEDKQVCYRAIQDLSESRAECERLRKRLQWAANELLVCDYGDNQDMQQVGWIVCGWREQKKQIHEKRRIYGQSIEIAIDGEIP